MSNMIRKLVVEIWQEKKNSSRGIDSPYLQPIAEAAQTLGLEFEARRIKRSSYTIKRQAATNELLLSYHTIGYAQQVFRLKRSYLKNYFYVDRTGFGGWAELAVNPMLQAKALQQDALMSKQFVHDLRNQLRLNNESKYVQPAKSSSDNIPQNCIFIALQKTTDISSDLAYIKQYALLDYLSQLAFDFPHLPFVIKRHPKCKDKKIAHQLAKMRAENIFITTASLHDILPNCKLVITCNSGVGFESLIYHRPVVCVGKSDYAFVCYTAKDLHQLRQYLADIPVISTPDVDSFLHFYLTQYCINIQQHEDIVEKLKQLLTCNMPPLADEIIQQIEAERERLNQSVSWGWREKSIFSRGSSRVLKKIKSIFLR